MLPSSGWDFSDLFVPSFDQSHAASRFDESNTRLAGFLESEGKSIMVKITLHNYRESKDYPKNVAADVERWKRSQVPYLERVIRCNLSRASRILRILRFHAHDLNLKPSITCYHHRKCSLRFSKSGEHLIDEAYSRHFVVVGKRNPFAATSIPET